MRCAKQTGQFGGRVGLAPIGYVARPGRCGAQRPRGPPFGGGIGVVFVAVSCAALMRVKETHQRRYKPIRTKVDVLIHDENEVPKFCDFGPFQTVATTRPRMTGHC